MRLSRKIWIGLLLEIIVAVIVHWILLEIPRGFAGTRTWWAKIFRYMRGDEGNRPCSTSADVQYRALPEQM